VARRFVVPIERGERLGVVASFAGGLRKCFAAHGSLERDCGIVFVGQSDVAAYRVDRDRGIFAPGRIGNVEHCVAPPPVLVEELLEGVGELGDHTAVVGAAKPRDNGCRRQGEQVDQLR
jgi:hypothetical protein